MCLVITSKKLTARFDFYTFKILSWDETEGAVSQIMRFNYEFGEQYSSELIVTDQYRDGEVTNSGFHSWVIPNIDDLFIWPSNTLQIGLRRFSVLCKIPKGSDFYLGTYNELASERIEIVKPLIYSPGCHEWADAKRCLSDDTQLDVLTHSFKLVRDECNTDPFHNPITNNSITT